MNKFKKTLSQNMATKEIKNNRTFSYTKKGVQLAFTLSTDEVQELKIYIELLEFAKADVLATIEEVEQSEKEE